MAADWDKIRREMHEALNRKKYLKPTCVLKSYKRIGNINDAYACFSDLRRTYSPVPVKNCTDFCRNTTWIAMGVERTFSRSGHWGIFPKFFRGGKSGEI